MAYDCKECIHEGNDEICDECSCIDYDAGYTCHMGHPPCSYCVNSRFEEMSWKKHTDSPLDGYDL